MALADDVGARIKQAREEAGLTQPQLATLIGLKHPQSISTYERGLTEVPARRLQKIAEATGKDLAFFLGDATRTSLPVSEVDQLLLDVRFLLQRIGRIEEALGISRDERDDPPPRQAVNGT